MMNCISYISSAAIFSQHSHVIMRSSLYAFSNTAWRGIRHSCTGAVKLNFILTGFRVQCLSTRRARSPRLPKSSPQPLMDESDAFYVVRKGDVIGIYRSLSDCQAQVSSSVCDPPVSVFKGYSLRKETEEYLASRGLKDALYSMNAVDAKEDLFGPLVPCPFKQPDATSFLVDKFPTETTSQKRAAETLESLELIAATSIPIGKSKKHLKLEHAVDVEPPHKYSRTCIIEFDGASKGNPGKAGAGAILRTEDGVVISRLREGLGIATNNVAEYRALILGMKQALKKGFNAIRVQGDSKLVCMQVNELWQTKNQNMSDLCKEAKGLKDKFLSFKISHVLRDHNSDADAQANYAVDLPTGEVYEESIGPW